MYEIRVAGNFDAAHYLRGYKGPCAAMHGHTWKVEICLAGKELGEGELLIDFHDVKKMLDQVIALYDHFCLNERPPFDELSPTSENIARVIFDRMAERLAEFASHVRLAWVRVAESPFTSCTYYPD